MVVCPMGIAREGARAGGGRRGEVAGFGFKELGATCLPGPGPVGWARFDIGHAFLSYLAAPPPVLSLYTGFDFSYFKIWPYLVPR